MKGLHPTMVTWRHCLGLLCCVCSWSTLFTHIGYNFLVSDILPMKWVNFYFFVFFLTWIEGQRMSFTVQVVKPTEAMGLWFTAKVNQMYLISTFIGSTSPLLTSIRPSESQRSGFIKIICRSVLALQNYNFIASFRQAIFNPLATVFAFVICLFPPPS